MKKISLFFFLVSATLLFSACVEKNKDSLVVGTTIDGLMTLDPAEIFEFSGMEYVDNTYNTLVVYDPKNPESIYGEVAESWAVSEDKKTITFKIRPNIQFASGNMLTAHDVVFSMHRAILLGKQPSQLLTQFGFNADNIKERIRASDDFTFVFEMDDAYAETFVLYCLTANVGAIVDQKEVMSHVVNEDMGNLWLKTHHAGSGAFKLGLWKPNEVLILEAHKGYFKGAPKINKLILQHISDVSSSILMLEEGDIDILKNIDLASEQMEKLKKRMQVERVSQGSTRYLLLNQKNQYLRIPEVQEAIRYLIDYEGIIQNLLKEEAFIHQTFIPKGFFGALNENPYSYNVEKARALLEKVGLGNTLSFTLETTNSELGQALQASFAKGGIKLVINLGDTKQVLTKMRERRYDIGLSVWAPDYFDPHANAATFSRNPDNSDASHEKTVAWRCSWNIPDLTKITEEAMRESDLERRKEIYHDLQKKLLASPIINIFQHDRVIVMRNNVHGIVLSNASNKMFYESAYKAK